MYRLPETHTPIQFPNKFITSPEGLLAIGGNLHPKTLLNAYAKGIFPWFNEGDPILWWHPDPRMVLYPQKIHTAKRIQSLLKKTDCKFLPTHKSHSEKIYTVTLNSDFSSVIQACAKMRGKGRSDTWITKKIIESYSKLHEAGFCHSIEVYNSNKKIVGGMYGVSLGKIFFGESMFSKEPNTSKIALICLCKFLEINDFLLIDCQVESKHLKTMGAENISRKSFLKTLKDGNTENLKPLKQ